MALAICIYASISNFQIRVAMEMLQWVNLLEKRAFHRLGFIAVITFAITVGVLSAVLIPTYLTEQAKFYCYTTAGELIPNNLRDHFYEKYSKTFNYLNLPIFAFVLLAFLLVLLVCFVYSQYVKPRVEQIHNAENRDQENQIHVAEQQRTFCCKIFTAYVAHLLIRCTLLALFLSVQWATLYPVTFPEDFPCSNNMTTEGNATSAHCKCKNQPHARIKSLSGIVLFAVNALFLVISLVETVYLARKAVNDKPFTEDHTFYVSYLLGRTHSTQEISPHPLDGAQQQEQATPASAAETFADTLKYRILRDTEYIQPLIPQSFKENEKAPKIKLDEIFVNLVIQTGRKIYEFYGKTRREVLGSYPEPGSGITLDKAHEIFTPNEDTQDPRAILAIGRAGIGKTLLAMKLLRDWASGVLSTANQGLKRFEFVFLLEFKWLNFEKVVSLKKLFGHSPYSDELNDEVFQHILDNPDKVLIIFDGLDESKHVDAIGRERRHGNSPTEDMPVGALFAKLATGDLLGGATILTTTRSSALSGVVADFYSNLNIKGKLRIVEILGFTPLKVQEYMSKFLPEDIGDTIWNHVDANVNLMSLCYIPATCFIVCSYLMELLHISGSHLDSATLPTTLTEIYKGALKCFLLRHHPLYREEKPKPEEFNPDCKFRDAVEMTLRKLGILAQKGAQDGRLIFSKREIMESANLTEDELKCMEESGLLHQLPDRRTGVFKCELQYCFVHLTLQEFLAARVIAADTEALASPTLADSKMNLVVQFVAGLLRGRENTDSIHRLLAPLITACTVQGRRRKDLLLLLQCLFEFHSDTTTSQVAKKFEAKKDKLFQLYLSGVNDSDCTSLVFFFKHFNGIGLNLTGNQIRHRGCAELAKLLEAGNLDVLFIEANNVGDKGLEPILEALQRDTCNLKRLNIKSTGMTAAGAECLRSALTREQCQLTDLNLSYNQLTDKGAEDLGDALESCSLQILDISHNGITAQGAKHLFSAIRSKQCKLTCLKLYGNHLRDEGMLHLHDALVDDKCKITSLDIGLNGITPTGSEPFCSALKCRECRVTSLSLYGNKLKDEGVGHLCAALSGECRLTDIDICKIGMTSAGCMLLVRALGSEGCKLAELALSKANLSGDCIKSLQEISRARNIILKLRP